MIQALKFTAPTVWAEPIPCQLDTDAGNLLLRLKAAASPIAYVVRTQDLSCLREFKEQVVDLGTKDPRIQLSRLLLNQNAVPLIDGGYHSAGQLKRSVRALLRNAGAIKEANVYFIGATTEIFDALLTAAETARRAAAGKTSNAGDPGQETPPSWTDPATASRRLLELLSDIEVPASLVNAYVGDAIEVEVVRRLVMAAAGSDDPVLILGETGTGKEIVAQKIHDHWKTRKSATGELRALNCSGIPIYLLESELFGYQKGSFAEAFTDKMGLWEAAQNGTLFLDEIGDLRLEHQAKILRALEDKTIRRVGGLKDIAVNARILAATNQDLVAMVRNGQFREDLYYRLRNLIIRTPPLRQHPPDIPAIAAHLWRKVVDDTKATLPKEVLDWLEQARWPGNVRDLKSVLNCLRTLFGKENLTVEKLEMAVYHLNLETAVPPLETVADPAKAHRAECLRRLLRAGDIVRACKVSIRPVLVRGEKLDRKTADVVYEALRSNLSELELLCLHPVLLHSEETFNLIYRFKGQLTKFHEILGRTPKQAHPFWKTQVAALNKQVISAVFKEVDRLLKSA